MALKVCVLASGSRGNCILIQTPATRILIDAGLSGRETLRRLGQLGLKIADIDALLIGHEHSDHTRGLDVLARKHNCSIFMNRATADALAEGGVLGGKVRIFTNGQAWALGDLTIVPFSVFHDAQDPVGFTVQQGTIKVMVATDLGLPTKLVKEKLKGARIVILEANHDHTLLMAGRRPWSLKQRIKSSQGHLSNKAAAELLAGETDNSLSDVFLAHLSQDCNRPELALRVVGEGLKKAGKGHVRLWLTYQDRISEVVEAADEKASARPSVPVSPLPDQLSLPLKFSNLAKSRGERF